MVYVEYQCSHGWKIFLKINIILHVRCYYIPFSILQQKTPMAWPSSVISWLSENIAFHSVLRFTLFNCFPRCRSQQTASAWERDAVFFCLCACRLSFCLFPRELIFTCGASNTSSRTTLHFIWPPHSIISLLTNGSETKWTKLEGKKRIFCEKNGWWGKTN